MCLVVVLFAAQKGVVGNSMNSGGELICQPDESRVVAQHEREVEGKQTEHVDSTDDMFPLSDCDSVSSANDFVCPAKRQRIDNETAIDNVSLQKHELKSHSRRTKKQCPLFGLVLTHLPRHLRSRAHRWQADDARAAVARFQLRKDCRYKNACGTPKERVSTGKDYHRRTRCPYRHCQSVVKRMSRHLVKVHSIRNPRLLTHYLQKAKQKLTNTDATNHSNTDPHNVDVEMNLVCESDELNTATNCLGENVVDVTDVNNSDVEPDVPVCCNIDIHDTVNISIPDHQTDSQFDGQSFQEWLTGPDGGRIDIRSAHQHVRQINNIIGHADSEHCTDLLLNTDYLLHKFLNGYAVQRQYQPGTIKSHLASLMYLYNFWLLAGTGPQNQVDQSRIQTIQAMKETVKRWSASYRKDVNKRCLRKMDEDL